MMDQLEQTAELIRAQFEAVSHAHNSGYELSRRLISLCSKSIRAVHREEWETALALMAEAKTAVNQLNSCVADYPELKYGGYVQDSIKEYAEAHLTYALVRDLPLPTAAELDAEPATWLNGLAEAATELRRRILDLLRHGYGQEVEGLLGKMDDIYSELITFDFNDRVTGGLRRRTDILRSVLERTRGDVTQSLRQAKLEQSLQALERKLNQSS